MKGYYFVLYDSYLISKMSKLTYRFLRTNSSFVNYTHLVHIKDLKDGIEACVEIIEEIDNLHGRALGREVGEPDDVAEIDGDVLVELAGERAAFLQLFSHYPRSRKEEVIFHYESGGNSLKNN